MEGERFVPSYVEGKAGFLSTPETTPPGSPVQVQSDSAGSSEDHQPIPALFCALLAKAEDFEDYFF